MPAKPLQTVLPGADDVAIDLISRMFAFNPEKRITVEQALRHPFFVEYFDEEDLREHLSGPFHWEGEGVELPGLHEILMQDAHRFGAKRQQRIAEYEARRRAGSSVSGDGDAEQAPDKDEDNDDAAAAAAAAQGSLGGSSSGGGLSKMLNAQSHLPRTGSFVSLD